MQAVVDSISRYLPGNRAGLSGGALKLLGVQTGGCNSRGPWGSCGVWLLRNCTLAFRSSYFHQLPTSRLQ